MRAAAWRLALRSDGRFATSLVFWMQADFFPRCLFNSADEISTARLPGPMQTPDKKYLNAGRISACLLWLGRSHAWPERYDGREGEIPPTKTVECAVCGPVASNHLVAEIWDAGFSCLQTVSASGKWCVYTWNLCIVYLLELCNYLINSTAGIVNNKSVATCYS